MYGILSNVPGSMYAMRDVLISRYEQLANVVSSKYVALSNIPGSMYGMLSVLCSRYEQFDNIVSPRFRHANKKNRNVC